MISVYNTEKRPTHLQPAAGSPGCPTMTEFFTEQLDYIEFTYGLAFFLLAVVSLILMKQKHQRLPWAWMLFFGVLHGMREWSDLLVPLFGGSPLMQTFPIVLFIASFIPLVEFGRSGTVTLRGRGPGRWIFAPLVAVVMAGGLSGWQGMEQAARYSLCLVGGLWSAWVLYRSASASSGPARVYLIAAAIALSLYTLTDGLVVPKAALLPGLTMSSERFLNIAGIPVALVKAVSAMAAAVSIWYYSQAPLSATDLSSGPLSSYRRSAFPPVFIIMVVIAAGWALTALAGNHARDQKLKEGNLHGAMFLNFLNDELQEAAHMAVERASSPLLLSALNSRTAADLQKASDRFNDSEYGFDSGAVSCRLSDRSGKTVLWFNHSGREREGNATPYFMKAHSRTIESGRVNGFYAVDGETLGRYYYVNSPVVDKKRGIVGMLTVKKSLEDIEEGLRRHVTVFLVDPHGVIFLSGRNDLVLRALWPISGEARKEILGTGQFGSGGFSPVLSQEPVSGTYAVLDGERYLATRNYVNRDGWSIVLLSSVGLIRTYRIFTIFTTLVFCGFAVISFAAIYFTRESAEQIASSERRYRSLVEGSPNCVILFDRFGACSAVNRAGLELMRCSEADLLGKRLDRLTPLDPVRGMDDIMRQALNGTRCSFDAESVHSDGKRVFWSAVLNPIKDLYGDVMNVVGILVDITDRQRAEQELRMYQRQLEDLVRERTRELTDTNQRLQLEVYERKKAEEELKRHREHLQELVAERTADLTVANEFLQLEISERRKAEEELKNFSKRVETVINSSQDIIMLKDSSFRLLVVNNQAVRFFNVPAAELVGKTDFDLMSVSAAEICRRGDEEALLEDGPHETEEEVAGRWYHVFKQKVLDAEGNAAGIVAVIRDITDRKKAEENLREYQTHLEEEVLRRTADLLRANERLTLEIEERRLAEMNLGKALVTAQEEKAKTEAIIAALGDGIIMQDLDYRVIYQNQVQRERFGDHTGELCYKAYEGLDRICEECPVEMSYRDGRIHRVERKVVTDTGVLYIELTSSPLRDASGKIIAGIKVIRDMTERRRAEENLRLFSMAIEEAMDGVQIVDLNGFIVYSNRAMEEIYGFTEKELLGTHVGQMNADPSFAEAVILPAIRDRGSWNGELSVKHKDGREFPVWLSASVVKDDSGNPLAMLGIIRDMTKRRQLEAAIKEISRQQEAILNNIPDLAWLKDRESRFIAVNEPFSKACGMKAEDLQGKTDFDIWPPDLAERYMQDDLDVIRSGRPKYVEEPLTDSEEHMRWVQTIKTPIYNDLGEVIGTTGIARDITERRLAEEELKRHREHLVELVEERTVELKTAVQLLTNEINFRKSAEETLKESETRYRRLFQEFHTLLDAIPDILLLLSPEMKVLWANRGAAAAFGSDVESLTGKTCFGLWHGRSESCDNCHAQKTFYTGEAATARRSAPGGRILDSRAFPIRDDEGKVQNVILVVTDITEKTSLQAEAMRASHLASLGELAAGVAHEINNPINGIINYAQILLNQATEGSREGDISGRIIKEGDRIAGIVRSLLSFARERKEEMTSVDVRKILGETLVLTETQIRKDGIHLAVELPLDLPRITANPQQLQQVFLNLISNARYALNQKFAGANMDKRMSVSACIAGTDEGPMMRLVFEDSGTGIPGEIMDRVMNPFFSTKPSGQGTGLGLSISHGIIKNHGGKILVESEYGHFTRVVIDLPLKEEHGR